MACYEAICHIIWLGNFISALDFVHSISKLLKLLCDNSKMYLSLGTLGALLAPSALM